VTCTCSVLLFMLIQGAPLDEGLGVELWLLAGGAVCFNACCAAPCYAFFLSKCTLLAYC
jgi:hypothetical protein